MPQGGFLLTRCPCCGVSNCQAHRKYSDRCIECGKRYAKYAVYKSMQKSNYSLKRQVKLDEIVHDYRVLKQAGYKVPKDIQ